MPDTETKIPEEKEKNHVHGCGHEALPLVFCKDIECTLTVCIDYQIWVDSHSEQIKNGEKCLCFKCWNSIKVGEITSRCTETKTLEDGTIVQCERYHDEKELKDDLYILHGMSGYFWKKIEGSRLPHEFRRAGLWLTNGGRIVKPGGGESCSKSSLDFPIMSADELQDGVSYFTILKRFFEAIRLRDKDPPYPHIFNVKEYSFWAIINDRPVFFPFTSKKKMHLAMDQVAKGETDPSKITK